MMARLNYLGGGSGVELLGGAAMLQLDAWVCKGASCDNKLPHLLSFAAGNYGRHTEWFLRHVDVGIRNLGAVLTAEFAVISLHFANVRVPWLVTSPMLILLALIAILLATSALNSCRRSFAALLENALLVTKTVWAMGLAGGVPFPSGDSDPAWRPVPEDPCLYVPRYLKDATGHSTTEAFVEHHLRNKKNTYSWGKLTICVFCAAAVGIGLVGACLIPFAR
jgi:hypothetical protein